MPKPRKASKLRINAREKKGCGDTDAIRTWNRNYAYTVTMMDGYPNPSDNPLVALRCGAHFASSELGS